MVAQLSRYLRGWRGYFGFCETPWVLRHLESWLRRRLRAVFWKQWKRGKVRYVELTKRGVRPELAAQTAGSAHGPWRLSNSPALNVSLSKAYFASLGLTPLAVN
jgi:RNA-directed DNA polymerase